MVGGGHRVLGVAVAVPALVDREAGVVVDAPNLGWHDVDVVAAVTGQDDALGGCPVRVDNDANCAALAEHVRGVARGVGDALYLTGTVGIGAGLLVDGEVRRGRHGFAGEVGHVPFGRSTRECVCGRRGCWEASIGLHAVQAAAGAPVTHGTDPTTAGAALAEPGGTRRPGP
nr:ROK family protein [Angustibacter aerolatus]